MAILQQLTYAIGATLSWNRCAKSVVVFLALVFVPRHRWLLTVALTLECAPTPVGVVYSRFTLGLFAAGTSNTAPGATCGRAPYAAGGRFRGSEGLRHAGSRRQRKSCGHGLCEGALLVSIAPILRTPDSVLNHATAGCVSRIRAGGVRIAVNICLEQFLLCRRVG